MHVALTWILVGLSGRPWRLVKNKLRTDYPVVQLNAWRVWPLVSFINYYYMPIHLRVLFHNLAAVCWGTFLILRSTRAIKQAAWKYHPPYTQCAVVSNMILETRFTPQWRADTGEETSWVFRKGLNLCCLFHPGIAVWRCHLLEVSTSCLDKKFG